MLPAVSTYWSLHEPRWLWLLLLLPLVGWLRGRRRAQVFVIPHAGAWFHPTVAAVARWPEWLCYVGLFLVVVAVARPQRVDERQEIRREGYDIMLVIDLSKSMWAEDYELNGRRISRIAAIRPVFESFILNRPHDRIGIVVFSGRAYTLAPLTFDHEWLSRQAARLQVGYLENGTAMGEGLATAVARLERSHREGTQGSFVVLMCDGANNMGEIAPLQAAAVARERGIPVFTIGAGKNGIVPFPAFDQFANFIGLTPQPSDLDEVTLKRIAQMTGAQYFHADAQDTLENAFTAINRAKKIEFQAHVVREFGELYGWLAGPGFLLIAVAFARMILLGDGPQHVGEVADAGGGASSGPPVKV